MICNPLCFCILPAIVSSSTVEANENIVWLEDLDLTKIYEAWMRPRAGQTINGDKLVIGGKEYTHGVGMHSETEFTVDLKGDVSKFEAIFSLDDSCGIEGSVAIEVWLDGKRLVHTGVMTSHSAPFVIDLDTSGAREMTVVITNGGNGLHGDVCDLVDARLVLVPGAKSLPEIVRVSDGEPTMPIASGVSHKLAINGPRVVGTTPGKPFLFLIPATGNGSLSYSAVNLPDGLSLDSKTGIISGSVSNRGSYVVELHVTNSEGQTARGLTIVAQPDKLALTPPMGWSSWNAFGMAISDERVRQIADALVSSGLAAHGYQYVNIDAGWGKTRDENGEFVPNEKFPDMKALAGYVHSKGLKLGIYSSPGPWTCGLCPDGSKEPGSWQHEEQDAYTFAKWGVDLLKHDLCGMGEVSKKHEDWVAAYNLMSESLRKTDRDIVFSICEQGLSQVWEWGTEINGQYWRTTHDIFDLWGSMTGIGFSHMNRVGYSIPGHWNDPDMMVVGKVGWGPVTRQTRLTQNEEITHMTLWCMLASPLLLGCDLTDLDQFTIDLLSNDEIIEVDQDPLGISGRRISEDGRLEIWARPLWDGTLAVGFFNRSLHEADITANWCDLGLLTPQPVRDLWLKKDMGIHKDAYTATIPAHGATMVKIGGPAGTSRFPL